MDSQLMESAPSSSPYALHWGWAFSKRCLDLFVSLVSLVVLSPLMFIIGIAILIDSPGPVLFNSVRVGKGGTPFVMYKFRSMVRNAEALLPELQSRNPGGNLLIKIPDDPRVTRVGRFLRRSSLDELPQLINVILGTMSLVGPRPQYPSEVAHYDVVQRRRLEMPPGITGLWQISARSSANFDDWVRLDLDYIDHWSPVVDIKILARTIPAVIRLT